MGEIKRASNARSFEELMAFLEEEGISDWGKGNNVQEYVVTIVRLLAERKK